VSPYTLLPVLVITVMVSLATAGVLLIARQTVLQLAAHLATARRTGPAASNSAFQTMPLGQRPQPLTAAAWRGNSLGLIGY
jgi:hypothetical protein